MKTHNAFNFKVNIIKFEGKFMSNDLSSALLKIKTKCLMIFNTHLKNQQLFIFRQMDVT